MKTPPCAPFVALALGVAIASLSYADEPPAQTKERAAEATKAAGEAVKRDAQAVGTAVKDGAQKVGVAAKEVAVEVAGAAQEGAHQMAEAAKTGVTKTKAAVGGEKKADTADTAAASSAAGHP